MKEFVDTYVFSNKIIQKVFKMDDGPSLKYLDDGIYTNNRLF